jgi:4-amino-4-deoxy-L-arabinose transferase-like glycosyltransferase
MKRVFSNRLVALTAGLCLRLYFVLKFPANSGDTVLYEQIATNWLKHHVYAMTVGGQITPVDLRMPGYPAFLAIVYALMGRTGADARLWVMLAQIGVDLLSCLVIARLATLMAYSPEDAAPNERVHSIALWLAALCPFTANYAAVPLTEVFATFWTALACCGLVVAIRRVDQPNFLVRGSHLPLSRSVEYAALAAGLIVGVGTLFRPEAPMLLIAAVLIFGGVFFLRKNYGRWIWVCLAMAFGCLTMLSPWAIRNMVTLDEPQFLAPKNSNLPGELVPYGFMAWEKTWLYRVRECYLVPWRLNEEAILVEDLPARAFDTPEEKQRVATILEPYNNDLMLTPEEDAQFSELARERNARHPLRTYLWVPAARAVTIWFTPRIELLPVSGHVFPLRQMREDDPVDQEVTSLFFVLNVLYVGLGIWGTARLWRSNPAARIAILFLALFIVLRTGFLTTLETPEPRYVLVCFPALISLGAQVFPRRTLAE